jgi:Protein of unknown function (DUF1997)
VAQPLSCNRMSSGNRSLHHHSCAGEYMTLPASQYSVLDAKRIERIDDDTFRCYVGGISFLNFRASLSFVLILLVS